MREKKNGKMYAKGFGKGFLQAAVVTALFYRNVFFSLFAASAYGLYFMFREKKGYQRKLYQEVTLQFREGLYGIAAALSAGYAMENAIEEARKDLILLYGEDSLLAAEFYRMRQKLEFNQPIEKVFAEFAEDWKTEDILHFVEVFQTAKRTGGDLIAITRLAAEKIGEKIEVRREIDTMIAGKKMEGRIMNLIPLGMILYFWLTSPGFLDCLYQSSGRIVMTVLMLLYVFAYRWSEKISDISV
jgi:tight adherence protein B